MKHSSNMEEEFMEYLEGQKGLIIKVAHAYCYDPEDRRDLIQDIILQLWKSFPRYKSTHAAQSTWTYRIALNVSISSLRKQKSRKKTQEGLEREWEFLQWDNAILDERLEQLYKAIEKLKALEKAQLILQLEGLKQKEIAEVLGISPSNVATRMQRIKKKLQQQLTKVK